MHSVRMGWQRRSWAGLHQNSADGENQLPCLDTKSKLHHVLRLVSRLSLEGDIEAWQ